MDTTALDFVLNFLISGIPGVFIALFAYQLDVRRRNKLEEQAILNGRKLLGLEIESNRSALAAFWEEINDLDEDKTEKTTEEHLAAMAQKGFLSYSLPHWNFTRWQHAQPDWIAGLNVQEVEQIDRIYRDLELIADLHARTVTLEPDERELLNKDRFWANRYGGMRDLLFDRLAKVVNRVQSAGNPLQA